MVTLSYPVGAPAKGRWTCVNERAFERSLMVIMVKMAIGVISRWERPKVDVIWQNTS